MKVGDKVDLTIGRISRLGFTVLINREVEGLLYKNELYVKLAEGDEVVGYIKKLREDGGIKPRHPLVLVALLHHEHH